jgi:hypothetical protein
MRLRTRSMEIAAMMRCDRIPETMRFTGCEAVRSNRISSAPKSGTSQCMNNNEDMYIKDRGQTGDLFHSLNRAGSGIAELFDASGAKMSSARSIAGAGLGCAAAFASAAAEGTVGIVTGHRIRASVELAGGVELERYRASGDLIGSANGEPALSQKGLEGLRCSGSSEFTEKGLKEIAGRACSSRLVVVDLREESHGYVDGTPMRWSGEHNWTRRGAAPEEVRRDEEWRLLEAKLMSGGKAFVQTEEELCHSIGAGYQRIPVSDHSAPEDCDVDRFVSFVKGCPAGTWLHFHCREGKGRTTSFMAMYDMMRNAGDVSLHDIIERQRQLGGYDLFSTSRYKGSYKLPLAERRKEFLSGFYQYCRDCGPDFSTSWSEWKASAAVRTAAS